MALESLRVLGDQIEILEGRWNIIKDLMTLESRALVAT